ncbi:phosphoglucosamine mutase [Kosmotoga arenicorallina S304]|uniref:Phosphoglucosamine mutase n=1 Tax=Kosmotoga arenicorallina S304 TaxID=1453497 RepID=A0A182C7X5_9BACT|nr:phosphoglucosamine mutase [Kosmotoga arenicorallina]OAA31838.1 phosphoglucosamine mutase [Kosmotoga arenicorallina S304]
MKKLFGTDGVRGIINEDLTAELAMKLGNAVSRYFLGKYTKLIIAKDTRGSGDLLENAVAAGAASAGMDVELIGVVPTPTLAFITKEVNTIGIMISASHNPAVYNGIKVLEKGMKISDEAEVEIEGLIAEKPYHYSIYSDVGRVGFNHKLRDVYLQYVIHKYKNRLFPDTEVIIDGANGAISTVIKEVYNALGLKADFRYIEPNGININDGCGSLHPQVIGEELKPGQIGVLFDGDADRCLFVLPGNHLVDGDRLMALNAHHMMKNGRLKTNKVVATIMSNLGFERFLREKGIELLRTKVGDKYVLEKMLQTDSTLGGEQSGHIIFLDINTTGDGLITSLETLSALANMGITLEEFNRNFPTYPQILRNVPVSDKKKVMDCERLKEELESLKSDNLRIVLRPSGTEPYIRIMVEGEKEEEVNVVCERLVDLVEECANE